MAIVRHRRGPPRVVAVPGTPPKLAPDEPFYVCQCHGKKWRLLAGHEGPPPRYCLVGALMGKPYKQIMRGWEPDKRRVKGWIS